MCWATNVWCEFNWLYHLLYVGKASAIHAPSFAFKCARHWKQIRIIHAIFCLEFAFCHIKHVESSPTRTLSGLSPSCYLFRMQIKGCLRLNCGLLITVF